MLQFYNIIIKIFLSDKILQCSWIFAVFCTVLCWKPEIVPDAFQQNIKIFTLLFWVSAIILSIFALIQYYLKKNKPTKNFHIEILESKSYVDFIEKDKSINLNIKGTVKNLSTSDLKLVNIRIIEPKFEKIYYFDIHLFDNNYYPVINFSCIKPNDTIDVSFYIHFKLIYFKKVNRIILEIYDGAGNKQKIKLNIKNFINN